MENYLNHIIKTNTSLNNDHKLSFINTITLDTFSSTEKNITKHPKTPPKSKSSKSILYLTENIIDKEIISDIDSTRNISEKNIFKSTSSKKDLKNEDENNKYIIVKDSINELSSLKTENKPNIKVRRDIFGTEIKKGGKQRISFADNAHILKSRKKLEDEGAWLYEKRHRQSVELTNINNENKIPKVRGIRRSLIGLKNDKLKKRYSIGNPDKKLLSLVEVIEIENYKEFNKISNFDIPEEKENIKEDQDTVCCSGICFIY
jgi:hypothetical protein